MNTFEYTVQKGDTLWLISKKFGITLDSLLACNHHIQDPDKIYPGDKVNVPMVSEGGVKNMPMPEAQMPSTMPSCPPNSRVHVVRPGETLWLIARRHGITLEALIKANPQISDPNRIDIGQRICIPTAVMPTMQPTQHPMPTMGPKHMPMPTMHPHKHMPMPTMMPTMQPMPTMCPVHPMPTMQPMHKHPMHMMPCVMYVHHIHHMHPMKCEMPKKDECEKDYEKDCDQKHSKKHKKHY